MKITLFLITILSGVFIPLSLTAPNASSESITQKQSNFIGTWLGDSKSDRYYFALTITVQLDSKIKGYHEIVALNGNKIDNGYPGPSITGTVKEDVATITFGSSFTLSKTGIAALKLISPDKIQWKTVKEINGENYFPDEMVLNRL